MSKKTFIHLCILSVILAIIYGVYSFRHEMESRVLPTIGQVRGFTLTDSQGKEVGYRDLIGSVWIAHFFFTTCSDICPVTSKHMGNLNRTFEKVPGVILVSITVNPENDTPGVLAKYAEQFVGGKHKWYFLTGPRETISDLAVHSFKLGSIEEPVFHSPHLSLVDRHGYIRGYYDGTDPEAMNKIFRDAAKLIQER